jgi:hypothetical protein
MKKPGRRRRRTVAADGSAYDVGSRCGFVVDAVLCSCLLFFVVPLRWGVSSCLALRERAATRRTAPAVCGRWGSFGYGVIAMTLAADKSRNLNIKPASMQLIKMQIDAKKRFSDDWRESNLG